MELRLNRQDLTLKESVENSELEYGAVIGYATAYDECHVNWFKDKVNKTEDIEDTYKDHYLTL